MADSEQDAPEMQAPRAVCREDDEDARLVAQFLRGEAAAFDLLVQAHQDRIARLAHRLLGWSGEVDDVVQEVFLAAFKNLRKFRGDCRVSTWLTTVTLNECRSARRRRFMRLTRLRRLSEEPRPAASSAAADEGRDPAALERIRGAVRTLPAKYREVVVLRYLEEMPVAEVGRALGLSAGAVGVLLHRARARLKDRLADLVEE
ncbi:MAG: sigma-70 family RNA polymerase sigma factor [Acidobacteria bacterium]|nr:sigma-70 family RNA polymerase sigma factor [Acidobacteriota bacterium]